MTCMNCFCGILIKGAMQCKITELRANHDLLLRASLVQEAVE